MNPRLSIVIPVYDNWWLTARLLRTLDTLRGGALPFETIVVDNASSDETSEAMRAFPWARYKRLETNRNFAGACNAGALLASAPLVLFLNNDAYPIGDALTPLVAAFDRPEVAIAGGALFFEDGVTQCAGFVLLPNAHWHYSYRNLPPSLAGVIRTRDALAVSGAAMAVRTQWFRDAGGFDETYVNGFEDVDLCMRARDRGVAILYVAESHFAHYEAASARRYAREAENEEQFYARWSASLASLPRVARGSAGAIAVRAGPDASTLTAAALDDLEAALRDFGHPLVRGSIRPWQRLDGRFRESASFGWFASPVEAPSVAVEGDGIALARLRASGASDASVPWLPCADVARVGASPLRFDPTCEAIAVAGFDTLAADRQRDLVAALDAVLSRRERARVVAVAAGASDFVRRFGDRAQTVSLLAPNAPGSVAVGAVVHAGLTDSAAFGNVLLAQSELASIVVNDELHSLFASDVSTYAGDGDVAATVERVLDDRPARERNARSGAADARRRFSPRRSAIRVVDLLCAARFGLERPAAARTNSPLER